MKVNKKKLKKEGIVIEALPDTNFKVKTKEGEIILAHLAGRLRLFHIRILPGDEVLVEISPYDPKRGRIIYRK